MTEFSICSLLTDDPLQFQEKINSMVNQGFEPDGPMSVIPMMLADRFNTQPKTALLFVLLMKRLKVHCPNT